MVSKTLFTVLVFALLSVPLVFADDTSLVQIPGVNAASAAPTTSVSATPSASALTASSGTSPQAAVSSPGASGPANVVPSPQQGPRDFGGKPGNPPQGFGQGYDGPNGPSSFNGYGGGPDGPSGGFGGGPSGGQAGYGGGFGGPSGDFGGYGGGPGGRQGGFGPQGGFGNNINPFGGDQAYQVSNFIDQSSEGDIYLLQKIFSAPAWQAKYGSSPEQYMAAAFPGAGNPLKKACGDLDATAAKVASDIVALKLGGSTEAAKSVCDSQTQDPCAKPKEFCETRQIEFPSQTGVTKVSCSDLSSQVSKLCDEQSQSANDYFGQFTARLAKEKEVRTLECDMQKMNEKQRMDQENMRRAQDEQRRQQYQNQPPQQYNSNQPPQGNNQVRCQSQDLISQRNNCLNKGCAYFEQTGPDGCPQVACRDCHPAGSAPSANQQPVASTTSSAPAGSTSTTTPGPSTSTTLQTATTLATTTTLQPTTTTTLAPPTTTTTLAPTTTTTLAPATTTTSGTVRQEADFITGYPIAEQAGRDQLPPAPGPQGGFAGPGGQQGSSGYGGGPQGGYPGGYGPGSQGGPGGYPGGSQGGSGPQGFGPQGGPQGGYGGGQGSFGSHNCGPDGCAGGPAGPQGGFGGPQGGGGCDSLDAQFAQQTQMFAAQQESQKKLTKARCELQASNMAQICSEMNQRCDTELKRCAQYASHSASLQGNCVATISSESALQDLVKTGLSKLCGAASSKSGVVQALQQGSDGSPVITTKAATLAEAETKIADVKKDISSADSDPLRVAVRTFVGDSSLEKDCVTLFSKSKDEALEAGKLEGYVQATYGSADKTPAPLASAIALLKKESDENEAQAIACYGKSQGAFKQILGGGGSIQAAASVSSSPTPSA